MHSQQQLINLLDLAIYVRNVPFFVLVLLYLRRCSIALPTPNPNPNPNQVLLYLRRCSIALHFIEKEEKVTKITGPWRAAIVYALDRSTNLHYDALFAPQFFDLDQHEALPLTPFIELLCDQFTRYQRFADGRHQIVPTPKQKAFLERIIAAEECFHFSEVGSGKTKVILPLLCQAFLSNNAEAHRRTSNP